MTFNYILELWIESVEKLENSFIKRGLSQISRKVEQIDSTKVGQDTWMHETQSFCMIHIQILYVYIDRTFPFKKKNEFVKMSTLFHLHALFSIFHFISSRNLSWIVLFVKVKWKILNRMMITSIWSRYYLKIRKQDEIS